MARPVAGYKTADGQRVPGVTTIVKLLQESGGLIHWAWQLGCDGKDYRDVRDAAASAGTLAHEKIEAVIRGQPVPTVDDTEREAKAANALQRFVEWREMTQAQITVWERPLVSERHCFGGTPDALATIHGRRALFDWKAANSVWPEYLCQLGGYALLLQEHGEPVDEAHLVRFDKQCEAWTHHQWGPTVLAQAKETFLLARQLYAYRDQLKKAAA